MDEISKKKLAEIAKKELHALTTADKIFLRARSGYLTDAQKTKFNEVISSAEETMPPVPDLTHIPYKELQKMAKKLGLPYVAQKKADLIVSISTVQGPEYPKE